MRCSWRGNLPDELVNLSLTWGTIYKIPSTVLRLSYDNAKVAIDLRRTSNLLNILRRMQGFVRLSENSVRQLLSILLGEILARFK